MSVFVVMTRFFASFLDEVAPGATDPTMWRDLKRAPRRRLWIAGLYGGVCHLSFALGVGAMILAMFYGMSRSLGAVPAPYAAIANLALLLQFPLGHSLLLTTRGRRWLARLGPAAFGADLATTTYAAIASVQVFLLFAFWTPSGVVWWEASGATFWILSALYAASWALLLKSMLDAGLALQSGVLGWWAVLRGVRPTFPDMPTRGLFRHVRQPIYATFALTLWTVPVWTPDQLAIAIGLTAYCLIGPLFKERRFQRFFGARFETYRRSTPYFIPRHRRAAANADAPQPGKTP